MTSCKRRAYPREMLSRIDSRRAWARAEREPYPNSLREATHQSRFDPVLLTAARPKNLNRLAPVRRTGVESIPRENRSLRGTLPAPVLRTRAKRSVAFVAQQSIGWRRKQPKRARFVVRVIETVGHDEGARTGADLQGDQPGEVDRRELGAPDLAEAACRRRWTFGRQGIDAVQ
jgi:hypothetical protein